jgi:hypothetical protein
MRKYIALLICFSAFLLNAVAQKSDFDLGELIYVNIQTRAFADLYSPETFTGNYLPTLSTTTARNNKVKKLICAADSGRYNNWFCEFDTLGRCIQLGDAREVRTYFYDSLLTEKSINRIIAVQFDLYDAGMLYSTGFTYFNYDSIGRPVNSFLYDFFTPSINLTYSDTSEFSYVVASFAPPGSELFNLKYDHKRKRLYEKDGAAYRQIQLPQRKRKKDMYIFHTAFNYENFNFYYQGAGISFGKNDTLLARHDDEGRVLQLENKFTILAKFQYDLNGLPLSSVLSVAHLYGPEDTFHFTYEYYSK